MKIGPGRRGAVAGALVLVAGLTPLALEVVTSAPARAVQATCPDQTFTMNFTIVAASPPPVAAPSVDFETSVPVTATVTDSGGIPVNDSTVSFAVTAQNPPTQPADGNPPNGNTTKDSPDPAGGVTNNKDGTYTQKINLSASPSRQTVT